MQKVLRKCLRSFFMRFSSIESSESIVVVYRYNRIRQSIDTIELISILLPSLVPLVPKAVFFRKNFPCKIFFNMLFSGSLLPMVVKQTSLSAAPVAVGCLSKTINLSVFIDMPILNSRNLKISVQKSYSILKFINHGTYRRHRGSRGRVFVYPVFFYNIYELQGIITFK